MRKLMAVVITGAMLTAAVAAQAQGRSGGVGTRVCTRLTSVAPGTLDAAETAGLVFTREEEKLARDVYLALHETWQTAIFVQIAGAEQRHMDAVKGLLDRYGIVDPVGANPAGVFADARLASLYSDLVAKGRLSLAEALVVGATIEDLDLADVGRLIGESDNADLDLVYGNLARGSRNHLRSFVSQLGVAGGSYTPVYLSAEVYAQVLASPQERGVNGQRMGRGRGSRGQAGAGNGSGTGVCDGTGQGPGAGQANGRGNGGGTGQGGGQGAGTCDGSGRP